MFEDSFLDSFMEGHIGGWTGDEDRLYAEDNADENCWADRWEDDEDEEEGDWVEPMDFGDLLNHNQRHLDEES
jgi:hypothetical protein